MTRNRPVLIFIAAFALHAAAQFVAWSAADAIAPSSLARIAFSCLSFPAFFLVSSTVATFSFWPTFFANSLVWAIAIAGAVALLLPRREAHVRPN